MTNQALFSLKDKSKTLKCCLQQFLFVTNRAVDRCILTEILAQILTWMWAAVFSLTQFISLG